MGRKTHEVAAAAGQGAGHPGVNVHPVLLGDGLPVFHRMSRQIDLELTECRPFSTGCVLLTYRVRRAT